MAFADVVATSTDPRLGAIRLAWWRERLEELDQGHCPAGEPRLQAVACALLPLRVSGTELSQLEDAWLALLEPFPWSGAAAQGLKLRGRILFTIGARLLGCEAKRAELPGALWSLVDGARHCSDPISRQLLLKQANLMLHDLPATIPTRLRPLTVLAALAAVDVVRQGSGLARLSAAFGHRLFGTFPRPLAATAFIAPKDA